MASITDRDKLGIACQMTIQFNFGSICDAIDDEVRKNNITPEIAEVLKRKVRNQGNDAIRVIKGHSEHYHISRNHAKDKINTDRVISAATKE